MTGGTGYSARVASPLLVRAVFALLVAATVGAFFVTQRLKRESPVVERVFFQDWISPNGDGRKDTLPIRFDLPEGDDVTVSVVDASGEEMRRLLDDARRGPGTVRVEWDGRTDDGVAAPDGKYRLRVTLRSEGRTLVAARETTLDTTPPRVRIVKVTPATLIPGERGRRGRVRIRFEGPETRAAPVVRIWRTDGEEARQIAQFEGPRFRRTIMWDGRVRGRPVRPGNYAMSVSAQDPAGNEGSAPPELPPTRRNAVERTGVVARLLAVDGPLEPVAAGSVVRLRIGPKARRFRWNLARAGTRRPVARGRADGRVFALRIPSDVRTGVYVLRVQAAGHRGAVPLAVRGRGRGRVLVVLPAITWQGLNPADDDRDGFVDTLEQSREVSADRPFADAGLPRGFERELLPFLRFLDRERLSYDLTTDLALARGRGPGLRGRPGVVFPASERWLTESVDLRLREWVEGGGKLAHFGTDSFRRRVEVDEDRLFDPSRPEATNVFGERTAIETIPPAPMVMSIDRARLFEDTDGFVGLFERFEQQEGLVSGSELLTAAGREPEKPSFVAYRLGDGVVVRAGSPDWNAALRATPDVIAVTRSTWAFLSR